MAKIQLVIEIEERLYKNIIDNDKDDEEFEAMDMAFCNAKPLSKGKWIPVIEKLPEEDGCYMVTMKAPFYEANAYGYITGAAYYISCVMKWYDANGEVIAWMPLPEPYTEVEE